MIDRFDPYYIPTAPGGISGPNCPIPDAYFCFLNARDQQNFAVALMSFGSRRGYRLVQGADVAATKALAVALGLTEHHVDTTFNRIGWGGTDVLAFLPLDEYRRRQEALLIEARRRADIRTTVNEHEARVDALGIQGITPYAAPVAEMADRAQHAARDDRPTVSLAGVDVPSTPASTTGPVETGGAIRTGPVKSTTATPPQRGQAKE